VRLLFMKRHLLRQHDDSLDVCTGRNQQVNIDSWMVQVFVNDGSVCRGNSIGRPFASDERNVKLDNYF
jgi:hypothetical protein